MQALTRFLRNLQFRGCFELELGDDYLDGSFLSLLHFSLLPANHLAFANAAMIGAESLSRYDVNARK